MSTKQLLIGILAFTLCTVGIITLLFSAYQMYRGTICRSDVNVPANVAVKEVTPAPSASPSATVTPTSTIKRIILVSPTGVRKATVSPTVSPAQ